MDEERRVLVVDDEPALLALLAKVISRKCGCAVRTTTSGLEALDMARQWRPGVVLTDIKMPGMDGLDLLAPLLEADPTVSVIIMTGYGTVRAAVRALKEGAYDFFEKPFDNEVIVLAIGRALERTRLMRENLRLQRRLRGGDRDLVGESPRLRQVRDLLARVAESDATVLIRGESGTGKEVAARCIHRLSARADRDMVTVNCPALPEQILESELFGYRRGAFTGADQDKEGLFLKAHGSTILLDEIADIPVSVQTKLLRVLQEKEIQPLGQTATRKVDVRVLASTNQDLAGKIRRGEFREDLYYRLNVITVTMPPLREISEDIPLLARHFLDIHARRHGREGLEFSPEAMQCLVRRSWQGNVRELENAINRAVILAQGERITPADLMDGEGDPRPDAGGDLPCPLQLPYRQAKDLLVRRFSVTYLRAMLERCQGNVSAAARESGMERQAMQRLMRRFGVDAREFRKPPGTGARG